MPLLNHDGDAGRDPLTFLSHWTEITSEALNAQFPTGPPAAGLRFRTEVARRTRHETAETVRPFGSTPDLRTAFEPPPALLTAPARFTDRVGVDVIDPREGRSVVASVLFVSPDHKADSDGALAFAVRAAALMAGGVGVVIVDVLPGPPSWATHLHSLVGVFPVTRRPRKGEATVLVVHPRAGGGAEQYDVWCHLTEVGGVLPTVPVPVRGATHLKLDLEAAYAAACERSRAAG